MAVCCPESHHSALAVKGGIVGYGGRSSPAGADSHARLWKPRLRDVQSEESYARIMRGAAPSAVRSPVRTRRCDSGRAARAQRLK